MIVCRQCRGVRNAEPKRGGKLEAHVFKDKDQQQHWVENLGRRWRVGSRTERQLRRTFCGLRFYEDMEVSRD
jgi:hypothetical protein